VFALISDVHGNCVALDAVLDELRELGVERGACLGDAVQGGPQPREVLDRLAELGWPVVLGNSDDFLLEVPTDSPEPVTDEQLEVREWTLAQLEPSHLEQIRSFPPTVTLDVDGVQLLAFHGSPSSYDDVVLPETDDDDAARLLGGDAPLLAGGHTHLQWTRRIGDALYVNPGAVGLAFDRHREPLRPIPVAEYALVSRRAVEFRRVPFDLEALRRAARARPHGDEYAAAWLG
jgi:predicted phosphodiesterase